MCNVRKTVVKERGGYVNSEFHTKEVAYLESRQNDTFFPCGNKCLSSTNAQMCLLCMQGRAK